MKQTIVIVGLGKMGSSLARNLAGKGEVPVLYNRTSSVAEDLSTELGSTSIMNLEEISKIQNKKVVMTFLPAGEPTDAILNEIKSYLNVGDTVIDFSNGHFSDDISRASEFDQISVNYLDCGISGGPKGAQFHPCLMLGGKPAALEEVRLIFDLLVQDGGIYKLLGDVGAGHYAKMVHNGIEYGIMQSIAEGFNILKESEYKFNLKEVAHVYSDGSVIESNLIHMLKEGFEKYGDLSEFSGVVESSGTGQWVLEEASKKGLDKDSIQVAVDFRRNSSARTTFTGKILSMLRNIFGGHSIV